METTTERENEMAENIRTRFSVRIDKMYPPSEWSVGFHFAHMANETYVYISLLFVSIAIGMLGENDGYDFE